MWQKLFCNLHWNHSGMAACDIVNAYTQVSQVKQRPIHATHCSWALWLESWHISSRLIACLLTSTYRSRVSQYMQRRHCKCSYCRWLETDLSYAFSAVERPACKNPGALCQWYAMQQKARHAHNNYWGSFQTTEKSLHKNEFFRRIQMRLNAKVRHVLKYRRWWKWVHSTERILLTKLTVTFQYYTAVDWINDHVISIGIVEYT